MSNPGMFRTQPNECARCSNLALVACLGVTILVSACTTIGEGFPSSFGNSMAAIELPATVETYPDDEVVGIAKAHFAEGNYGHAARYYERAVEVEQDNGEAWLGLAASYDRIRRFDLADRAYRTAARYVGHRPEYFNNVGYSYLLRGDIQKARSNFLKALELDADNPTLLNNLELLRESVRKAGTS